jgi:site-specific DNA-methyltransferase (adenine-specific)
MPREWRSQFQERIAGLRGEKGNPDAKVCATLRLALSLVKAANDPGAAETLANANQNEALAAMRQALTLFRPERHHGPHREDGTEKEPASRLISFARVRESQPKLGGDTAMLDRASISNLNVVQRGDGLALLRSLPHACTPLVFFDPQHRAVLDHLKFGNEGTRQRGRAGLPAMSEEYISVVESEIARVLRPSGYLMYWMDTFRLCEAHHLRIPLKAVDLIAWDSLRPGMGKRSRRRGDYLTVLQKPPIKAGSTWRDHGIPSRWPEKVDRRIHPHIKPIGLIARLIAATTEPSDLVVDPAAGSFAVMRVAHQLGRHFIGCDLASLPAQFERGGPLLFACSQGENTHDRR